MEVIFLFIYVMALSQSNIAYFSHHISYRYFCLVCNIVLFIDSLFVIRKIFLPWLIVDANNLAFLMTSGIVSHILGD